MVDCLWNGEIECRWDDLENKVIEGATRIKNKMLEAVSYSPNQETHALINEKTMRRFSDVSRIMSEDFEMERFELFDDLDNKMSDAYKLNCWILLGSLTECVLQIFLAFYIDDYRRSKWQQWEEVDTDSVKNTMISTINDLVQEATISSPQGKSLKNAINDKIEEHTVEHPVQRIMLDEIISYYSSLELMGEKELGCLRQIQYNRNGIHIFEDRTINSWDDLKRCVSFWCYLLEWILNRLPDTSDYS